jgi:hypothetical protein
MTSLKNHLLHKEKAQVTGYFKMKHILNIRDWSKLNEDAASLESTAAADITPTELTKAVTVVNGLIKRGFTKNEAISLAGNMSVESRQPPNPAFNPSATDGRAVGLCQWQGDRLKALKAYAKSKGLEHTTMSVQLDFIKYEMKDYYLPYVQGVPKELVYINSGTTSAPKYIKTRKELTKATAESRNFENGIKGKTTVSDLTGSLCDKVFRPTASLSHRDRRIANALKIQSAIG